MVIHISPYCFQSITSVKMLWQSPLCKCAAKNDSMGHFSDYLWLLSAFVHGCQLILFWLVVLNLKCSILCQDKAFVTNVRHWWLANCDSWQEFCLLYRCQSRFLNNDETLKSHKYFKAMYWEHTEALHQWQSERELASSQTTDPHTLSITSYSIWGRKWLKRQECFIAIYRNRTLTFLFAAVAQQIGNAVLNR